MLKTITIPVTLTIDIEGEDLSQLDIISETQGIVDEIKENIADMKGHRAHAATLDDVSFEEPLDLIGTISEIAFVDKDERIIGFTTKDAADSMSEQLKDGWSQGRGQVTGPFRSLAASKQEIWHVTF